MNGSTANPNDPKIFQPAAQARRQRWILILLILLAAWSWWRYCVCYVSDDCFFYPVIARHLATTGRQTFSGIFPTNGVHPLWLYLLSAYSFLVAHLHAAWLNHPAYAVPLSAALLALGAWQFLKVTQIKNLNPLWLLYIPLAFVTYFGLLYSEAHASYAALGVLLRLSVDGTIRRRLGPLWIALAAAAVFAARLDNAFFVAAYALWLWTALRSPRRWAAFAAVLLALTVPDLLYNQLAFGGMVPVSGYMKSSFPHLCPRGLQYLGLGTTFLGCSIVFGLAPLALSLALLLVNRRAIAQAANLPWAFWWGSFLQLLYIALFTHSHTHWYWYYVLPVVSGAYVLAVALGQRISLRLGRLVAAALLAIWLAATFSTRWRTPLGPAEVRRVMVYIDEHHLQGQTVLMADFPGYLAFMTSNPIVAADFLTADRATYQEMRLAPSALQFLFDRCRRAGHPVRLIVYTDKSVWLVPDDDLRGLTYNDPRAFPVVQPIGHLRFSAGPAAIDRNNGRIVSVIWDLNEE